MSTNLKIGRRYILSYNHFHYDGSCQIKLLDKGNFRSLIKIEEKFFDRGYLKFNWKIGQEREVMTSFLKEYSKPCLDEPTVKVGSTEVSKEKLKELLMRRVSPQRSSKPLT